MPPLGTTPIRDAHETVAILVGGPYIEIKELAKTGGREPGVPCAVDRAVPAATIGSLFAGLVTSIRRVGGASPKPMLVSAI